MIVIIDDSPTALVVLKSFAGERGLREVTTFTDPIKGFEFLQQNSVDAVVVDCTMPGLDGIQLTQRLREGDRHKETPIIMVTGSEHSDIRTRARVSGATAFLGKPVRMAEFKATLAAVLKDGGWPYVDRREQSWGAPPDDNERRSARA